MLDEFVCNKWLYTFSGVLNDKKNVLLEQIVVPFSIRQVLRFREP